jgi:signal transduction histidine kinase/CheY-like chemotaxis protein
MEALAGIAIPIFAVNCSGIVLAWNHRMYHTSGLAADDVCQHCLSDFLVDAGSWEVALNTIVQSGAASIVEGGDNDDYVEHCSFELKDGTNCDNNSKPFKVRVVANYSEDGNAVVGAVCFAEHQQTTSAETYSAAKLNAIHVLSPSSSDTIGSTGMAYEAAEHLPRKSQLLKVRKEATLEAELKLTAYFAHELRNPLSALDSALNSISDASPQEMKNLVTEMQSCIKIMCSIMNNLIDVRKLEEGKIALMSAPLSLHCLMTKVQKTLLPSVKPGVSFYVDCDTGDQDWILGDATRLQQILTNIAANAIKYTVTGTVTLKIGWENHMVTFVCIDTGPHSQVPLSQQEQFSLPYRCGAPSAGLEMVIAKHLVELHQGTMIFRSVPTSDGANVIESLCIVHLPLVVSEPTHPNSLTDASQMIETPLRFVIVDDIKVNRHMLNRRLQNSIYPGCIVAEACTGEEALFLCGKQDFDVIIVDQYMEEAGGVMVGTDAIYALRRMGVTSIVIGCSGNDLDEEFIDAGVDIVWQKPIPCNEEIKIQICRAILLKNNI